MNARELQPAVKDDLQALFKGRAYKAPPPKIQGAPEFDLEEYDPEKAPGESEADPIMEKLFSISLTYYIAQSDQASASAIQKRVDAAVSDFVTWQTTEIGRDVNPTELIHRVQGAGAKRVVLESPAFTAIAGAQVAQLDTISVVYGGLEDD